MTYKTFSDLQWKPHHLAIEVQKTGLLSENRYAEHAVIVFDNGFGVSVVRKAPLITNGSVFEIAVIRGTPSEYVLVYDTGITEDIIRCDTEEEINDIMRRVQDL